LAFNLKIQEKCTVLIQLCKATKKIYQNSKVTQKVA
jgi:hypothetical protein